MAGTLARGIAEAAGGDVVHSTLHLKKIQHHHHDDGSYQVDDSVSSFAHVLADASHANTALQSPEAHISLPDMRAVAPVFRGRELPSPDLPLLQRPPRRLS